MNSTPVYPAVFERKPFLCTPTEQIFHTVLKSLVERTDKLLFAKVRLEDLVGVHQAVINRSSERNRIKSRHIDFVICDKETRPLLAIELDDHWHSTSLARYSDEIKDKVLDQAGVPLLRIKVKSNYDPLEITRMIRAKLAIAA